MKLEIKHGKNIEFVSQMQEASHTPSSNPLNTGHNGTVLMQGICFIYLYKCSHAVILFENI